MLREVILTLPNVISVCKLFCLSVRSALLLALWIRMSVLNQSGEEQVECPLCMEPLEVDDLHFYPCTCGYQICRFCWNRIREGENGLCPACRKAYPENPADFTPLSQEQVAAIKTEKKAREQKRRNKTLEWRRTLANVRVVQNNLVFVVGLPVRLADPEILKRQEYFGKYGKIHKVVINQSTTYAGTQQGPSASAYVTYVSPADALRAIQGVNNVPLDGRVLKGSLGTTKYCANFMKNQPCPKPDCMYLHELGDPKASFTKEDMHAGLHQVYERKLHNQLLAAQKEKPEESKNGTSGNSSTNVDKSGSKDGNQSNFIPTTVVTSSNINVVNSSKSRKDTVNGSGSSNSTSSSSSSGSSSGKEAWPSLGASPPNDSPARKQSSPKPQHSTGKSQENGTSESSSPTQSSQPPPTQTQHQAKIKDTHTEGSKTNKNKDSTNANGQSKKSKTDKKKTSNSISTETDEAEKKTQTQMSFEQETEMLNGDLDEIESDRHSLLENLDNDHSLLEDETHNLLNDANNEILMMHRHREMLAGLVENNHMLPQAKNPLVNGYSLVDRDTMSYIGNDRPISQISQGLMDQKEMLLRERSRSEMLMRQNELLARQQMVEPKHYMPTSSIALDSASDLLGANFHSNPNILPPFGMRVDNSISNSMSSNSLANMTSPRGNNIGNSMSSNSLGGNLGGNTLGNMNALGGANLEGNSLGNTLGGNAMNSGYLLHNQQLLQQSQHMQQSGLVNGFDNQSNEGRYLAENMDKFFTDFHKAQQMRSLLGNHAQHHDGFRHPHHTHNMLSADRLEMEHKQRMSGNRDGIPGVSRAAGDCDDDLDFDPFKETQKALAEMMESEMMQNNVNSGTRLPPPGFSHLSAFGLGPRHHNHQQDWTQMDPAIMSTSVNFGNKPQPLNQQQQELFARFNALSMNPNVHQNHAHNLPNGISRNPQWAHKMSWPTSQSYNNIPLPPGFAPTKNSAHPAECIDAK